MPVAYVDIPAGMNDGAKKKIFQEPYEEIHQAWPIPDTRVLIREWPTKRSARMAGSRTYRCAVCHFALNKLSLGWAR
jgi:hypothetical protein